MKLPLLISSVFILTGCGTQQSRVYKKQRSESDIKISHLDLQTGTIKTRLQYQSYIENTLDKIDCSIMLNSNFEINMILEPKIQLGAFSKEVLSYSNPILKSNPQLVGLKQIDYNMKCLINYAKGNEYLQENSTLFMIPATENLFR
jgi:hypothetical protein